jgi:hypothetical protein
MAMPVVGNILSTTLLINNNNDMNVLHCCGELIRRMKGRLNAFTGFPAFSSGLI